MHRLNTSSAFLWRQGKARFDRQQRMQEQHTKSSAYWRSNVSLEAGCKREAKTKKETWLKALAERRGNKCAAVALTNKTVRTAFAMHIQGTEYQAELLAAKNEFIEQKNA
jgi:hypothetical protein